MNSYVTGKTIKQLKEINSNFNFNNAVINNFNCISDRFYNLDVDILEPRGTVYIESVDKNKLELYFRQIEIFHIPDFPNNNVILKKVVFEYKNGYFYFKNNTEITEKDYKNSNCIFIKSKLLELIV